MNCFRNGLWRLNKGIGEVYVPQGAEEQGLFLTEHPITKVKVQVKLQGTKLQCGDVVRIDENGDVKDVYSDEERGWFWYSYARSGIMIFVSSFVVAYLLAFGNESANNEGKMDFFGTLVLPSTAITASLLITYFAIAIFNPLIGALADFTHYRKSMLGNFAFIGVFAAFGLAPSFYARSMPACLVFTYTIIFCYEITASLIYAYLPEITPTQKIPKLSGYGLFLTTMSQVVALTFVLPIMSVAGNVETKSTSDSSVKFYMALCACILGGIWAVGTFLTLLLLKPRSCRRRLGPTQSLFTVGFSELARVGKKTKMFPQLFRFLLAHIFTSIAFGSITSMSSIVLSSDFGWEGTKLAFLLVLSQIVAMIGGLMSHRLTSKFGSKRLLLVIIGVYAVCCPIISSLYYTRGSCVLNGWTPCETSGKCYRHFSQPLTFDEATAVCLKETRNVDRGRLASFSTPEQVSCGAPLCPNDDCWVGRRYFTSWATSDGDLPLFWLTPDSAEPSPAHGDCLALNASSFWDSAECDVARPFVCEKSLVKESGHLANGAIMAVFMALTYFGGLHISISRAYVALMIPPDLEAEMYGLYGFCAKAMIWLGVSIFAIVNEVFGDFRWAFVLIVPFFLMGAWSLLRVDDRQVDASVRDYMLARRDVGQSYTSVAQVKLNLDS
eukprot:c52287_g1_i1.p1 GENE.c52287_g1_i1~~c52287_g1_i1.p1  ORF type:complete len:666 (-),score=120.65 c52287_g1_i1:58-2055(-)